MGRESLFFFAVRPGGEGKHTHLHRSAAIPEHGGHRPRPTPDLHGAEHTNQQRQHLRLKLTSSSAMVVMLSEVNVSPECPLGESRSELPPSPGTPATLMLARNAAVVFREARRAAAVSDLGTGTCTGICTGIGTGSGIGVGTGAGTSLVSGTVGAPRPASILWGMHRAKPSRSQLSRSRDLNFPRSGGAISTFIVKNAAAMHSRKVTSNQGGARFSRRGVRGMGGV